MPLSIVTRAARACVPLTIVGAHRAGDLPQAREHDQAASAMANGDETAHPKYMGWRASKVSTRNGKLLGNADAPSGKRMFFSIHLLSRRRGGGISERSARVRTVVRSIHRDRRDQRESLVSARQLRAGIELFP